MPLGSWLEAKGLVPKANTEEEPKAELAKARAETEELKTDLAKVRAEMEELRAELAKANAEKEE